MPKRKKRQPPRIGTTCRREFKGKSYRMNVVATPDGVGYQVGRTTFRSPSAAAKSITKTEVNGWAFWGLDR